MVRAGWFGESHRHSLAARGIATRYKNRYYGLKEPEVRSKDVVVEPITKKKKMKAAPKAPKTVTPSEMRGKGAALIRSAEAAATGHRFGALGRSAEEERRARVAIEGLVEQARPIVHIVDQARKGQLGEALLLMTGKRYRVDPKTGEPFLKGGKRVIIRAEASTDELDAIHQVFEERALGLAKQGLPIPDKIVSTLSPEARAKIDTIKAGLEREEESPLRAAFRKKGEDAAIGALQGVEAIPGAVAEEATALAKSAAGAEAAGLGFLERAREEASQEGGREGFAGTLAMADSFGSTPFMETNALFGSHTDGDHPLNLIPDDVPSLKSGFDDIPKLSDSFFGSDKVESVAQRTSRKVDSWLDVSDGASDVDVSGFDRGNDAFDRGDREGLISAITSLQSQESKVRDRWQLVEQTHAQVLASQNKESAFDVDDGGNFFLGFGSGAGQLVEQTEKLNKVKEQLKGANDRVFSRRKMLQFKLQRMDAHVPSETDVPDDVQVFGGSGPFSIGAKDIFSRDNIVLKTGKVEHSPVLREMRGSVDE